MQISVECMGPQQHKSESYVFIQCMVLLLSCVVEESHLAEDTQGNKVGKTA